MNTSAAIESLAALAQESRLHIFRLLVQHAPQGLPAGSIAGRLRLPGPTLSFHLNVLAAAGLVRARKNGRSIAYSANLEGVHGLTRFLLENCCGGRKDCTPPAGAGGAGRETGRARRRRGKPQARSQQNARAL